MVFKLIEDSAKYPSMKQQKEKIAQGVLDLVRIKMRTGQLSC